MAGGRHAAVFKAALQRAARARTLALAAARGDGRPMRMHTYGSRRCGSAGSGGGKGRERISSSCTQSDEDSAPVGEQQLVKKPLAGFTCRSSEMISARVPNAERLTTPARPGGRTAKGRTPAAAAADGCATRFGRRFGGRNLQLLPMRNRRFTWVITRKTRSKSDGPTP